MIEINLLPEEMRKADHTPPARLGTIALGVLIFGVLGSFVGFYKIVKIPNMINEILTDKVEIKNLEVQKAEVDAIDAKITSLNTKVTTLTNLIATRLLYARLMDALTDAINRSNGAWLRSFSVTQDGASPQGAKKFQLSLTGYTIGNSDLEMNQNLTLLINSLSFVFRENPEIMDKDTGFNRFLGATFDRPLLLAKTVTEGIPAPLNVTDPVRLKVINAPKQGLDFNLTIGFALQAPKQPQ